MTEDRESQYPPEFRAKCRKCGQPITGQAFGSQRTGWEHPMTCPAPVTEDRELDDLRAFVQIVDLWIADPARRHVVVAARRGLGEDFPHLNDRTWPERAHR